MASSIASLDGRNDLIEVKISLAHVEQQDATDLAANPDFGKSEEEKRALDRSLTWKVDRWLMPWLCLLYLLSFLDRTNIGNARLAGLEEDLGMRGHDFNNTLTIFFVSYSLAEPVTNVLLKRVTPRIFFTAIILLWGICMTMMGIVTDYASVNYYLSCWYKRNQLGVRAAFFLSSAALAGSFGGLLAAALAKMNGVAGKPGWAWIFLIEGLVTVLVGVFCWWMVFNWPDTAGFLTSDERLRLCHRLAEDRQASTAEQFDKQHAYSALKDWKTWLYTVIFTGCCLPLYSFSLFLPTILQGMGYTGTRAQLLSVPPYATAAAVTVLVGWLADKTKVRGPYNIGVSTIGAVGFSMLIGSGNAHIQYTGTFLGAIGIYPAIPNTLTWVSNNIQGMYRRGVTIGVVVGLGNLSGIVSSNVFLKSDSPRFQIGLGVVLTSMVLFLLLGSTAMHVLLRIENQKRLVRHGNDTSLDTTVEEMGIEREELPSYRYTL